MTAIRPQKDTISQPRIPHPLVTTGLWKVMVLYHACIRVALSIRFKLIDYTASECQLEVNMTAPVQCLFACWLNDHLDGTLVLKKKLVKYQHSVPSLRIR